VRGCRWKSAPGKTKNWILEPLRRYRTDRKRVGGRGCWEYTDGKEWDEFVREMRVVPVLASHAFNWDFSLRVVGSEGEYGACSAFFMDATELGNNVETAPLHA